jgi:nucleoside-diphosphate-sugar epimerase
LPLILHDLAKGEGLDDAVRGFDAVVHCAAAMGGSAEEQRASTVTGTRNLVAAMGAASVTRIVHVSSFAVYDYTALRAGDVLTEDTPIDADGRARGPYVSAKREQENIVTGASSGTQWTIMRPGLVFGPGRTWFYHLGMQLSRRLWVSLAGAGVLPLTHVENCAAAIVAALEQPGAIGTMLNVVDDNLPTRRSYLGWLGARQAPRPLVIDVPWSALSGASRIASMAVDAPPGTLHPAVLAARCKPLRYDNTMLKRVLSWAPAVSIRDGLDAALDAAG